jgi:hypothetical protein
MATSVAKEDAMKNRWFWGLTFCVGLFSVSPARAEIVANLEEPASSQTGVGLSTIRGFAYDTGGKEVTIRPRFDGVTFDTVLSCCDLRQDVTAEPDSGFNSSINYGTLFTTPGPHLVGVEVSSSDGDDTVVVDHAVVVLHPGNASFVTNFDLSAASCSIQGNQVVITGAALTSTGGTPVTTNLTAAYATNSQSLVFTAASGAPTPTNFTANLNGSQEVPPPTSLTGIGTGALVLNTTNNTITSCSVTFSNLTGPAVAAHIHLAPPGVAGPIIVPLTLGAGGTSPATCTAGTALTADQVTALLQGNLYFNVHTSANMAGEGRGQIVAAPAP